MTKYAEFPPYARILEATGLRTQQELAEALGVRPPSITFALRRQNIPTGWLVTLVENYGLNPA